VGRSARPLHDPGNDGSIEPGFDLQAARRQPDDTGQTRPSARKRRRSYTRAWDTIGTAAALGLTTEGTGTARDSGGDSVSITVKRMAAVRLGYPEMKDQPFAVLALPWYLTDRGSRRPPIAGFIGYERLARFAVRRDYEGKTLTAAALGLATPRGRSAARVDRRAER
jgi:hypothetical protein